MAVSPRALSLKWNQETDAPKLLLAIVDPSWANLPQRQAPKMSGSAKTLFGSPSEVELDSLSSSPSLRTTWLSDQFEKSSSSGSSSIKIAFIDAWRDISSPKRVDSSRCRRVGWQFLAIIWIGFLLTLLGYLPIGPARSNGTPCRPDGDFQMDANEMFDGDFYYGIDWWAAESFFQITLSWGKLTFTSAKLIDVVWDLVRATLWSCCGSADESF